MVERATVDDVVEIANIIAEYRGEGKPSNELAALRIAATQQLHTCIEDSSHRRILVARDGDNDVAGYLAIHWIPFPALPGFEGYISDLIVAAKTRGQGFGQRLLQAAENEAKAKGACRLMLNNRQSAVSYERQFYSKSGFTERVGFSNFVKDLSADA